MSKTSSFTIDNRRTALEVLNAFKGKLEDTAVVFDDAKNLVVTEEEWTKANLVKDPTDEAIKAMPDDKKINLQQKWTWDPTYVKEITLSAVATEFILKTISEKTDVDFVQLQHLKDLKDKLS